MIVPMVLPPPQQGCYSYSQVALVFGAGGWCGTRRRAACEGTRLSAQDGLGAPRAGQRLPPTDSWVEGTILPLPLLSSLHSVSGTGGWSARGCELLSRNRTHVACQCSHTASFAVLMDISRREVGILLWPLCLLSLPPNLPLLTLSLPF